MTRTLRALLLVATLGAVACGGSGSAPASPPEPATAAPAGGTPPDAAPASAAHGTQPRIVFLGDSLTAGYGIEKEQAVPALIQKRLRDAGYPYEVVNAGVSGDTSAGGVSRLDWSLDGDVDVLVIELGGNDGLRGLPPAQTRQNIDTIIRRARQKGIAVLLTGMEAPPNYGAAYTADFRQVFRDLAREHHVAFMPFYLEGVAGNPRLNQGDGIHPNPEGARIVASNVWRALEPLLQKPRS